MKTIEKYTPKVFTRVWGDEIFIAETKHYLGKVLKMRSGTAGGLQRHVEKDETFYLLEGKAIVDFDNGDGKLVWHLMVPGESFHIPPGAPHRVTAVDDCIFFEASTPHYDDRIRMEEDYGLEVPTGEGELQTTR